MAFTGAPNLAEVHISDLSAWCNVSIKDSGSPVSSRTNFDTFLYVNDAKLTSLTIPSDVFEIADGAFQNFAGINTLILHNKVTSIGARAFEKNDLQSVILPEGILESIGERAFKNCKNINKVKPQLTTNNKRTKSKNQHKHTRNSKTDKTEVYKHSILFIKI
jgi:hypothetical protein